MRARCENCVRLSPQTQCNGTFLSNYHAYGRTEDAVFAVIALTYTSGTTTLFLTAKLGLRHVLLKGKCYSRLFRRQHYSAEVTCLNQKSCRVWVIACVQIMFRG